MTVTTHTTAHPTTTAPGFESTRRSDSVVTYPWALAELGHALAEEGFGPYEAAVADLSREAARRDAAPALLAVLADTTAPEVVRLRAYARAAALVSRP